ncbi:MAG TPA: hypothetical protein VJ917_10960 [Saprospiraceae bacterium]|nr:hypothetical protein [Saprospiraceae bacterium]
MKINLNFPERFLNAQLRTVLGHNSLSHKGIQIIQAKIVELACPKDQHTIVVAGHYTFVYVSSIFATPPLEARISLKLHPLLSRKKLSFQVLSIEPVGISGFSQKWKDKWLSRFITWVRPFLIKQINNKIGALADVDLESKLKQGILSQIEHQVYAATGLQLVELKLQLNSFYKEKDEDLWIELGTQAEWKYQKAYLDMKIELFPDQESQRPWHILLNEEVLHRLIDQFLIQKDLQSKIVMKHVGLNQHKLVIDFEVKHPVRLQLQWSANIVLGDEEVELSEINIGVMEGRRGWKEILALPGLRWMMNRKWSDKTSWTYQELNVLLNQQVISAMGEMDDHVELSADLNVESIQWQEAQLSVFIHGDINLDHLH